MNFRALEDRSFLSQRPSPLAATLQLHGPRDMARRTGFLKTRWKATNLRSIVIIVTRQLTRTATKHLNLYRKYLSQQRLFSSPE